MDFRRKIALIKLLHGKDEPMSSKVLCDQLGITSRTLRNDLRAAEAEFRRNGFAVRSRHAVGYYLDVFDQDAYARYIQALSQEQATHQMLSPVYPEDRIDYLVCRLLSADGYIKADDMAEELFVSRATLTSDLKLVRDRLDHFHLELESKPGAGLAVVGSEMHLRSAIAQYFFHTESSDQTRLDAFKEGGSEREAIADILYQTILDEGFRLTDLGFQNLVIHLAIAIMRLRQQELGDVPFDHAIKDAREYEVAGVVCQRLGERFGLSFPESERAFVAMHLSGKQAMQYHQLSGSYEKTIDRALADIAATYRMDFTFDMDLRTALALHLEPMMARLTYGMVVQNPLLDHVKTEVPLAFEMGVLFADDLRKEHGLEMSDAEIGFISLHFALAIERFKAKGSKKNVIVICASGLGSSQILMYKIRSRFGAYIESILAAQLYDLRSINQQEYDFILSTVPVPFPTEIPVINIQYFLDDEDLTKVEGIIRSSGVNDVDGTDFVERFFSADELYTDLVGRDRYEIIHEMVARLGRTRHLPADFEEQVLRRERFAATEFGNGVAMPHPLKAVTYETFVAVAVLRRAVRWDQRQVRFVFLLSVSTDEQETFGPLHETLSALVFDKEALDLLGRTPTMGTLRSVLSRLAEAAEGSDLDELFG